MTDPREELLAKVVALKASLRSGKRMNHEGARLVSAGRVTWFACPRCKKLLTGDEWAAPCEPKETSG